MKRITLALLLAASASTLSSCATTHLWRWALDKTSAVHEVKDETVEAFIKPSATLLLSPAAVAWDLATLPAQLLFRVYPYFDQVHMAPAERK